MPPLNSSAITFAQWTPGNDETLGTLDVTFSGGQTYTFEGVPKTVYEGLLDTASPGRYYYNNIKGQY